MKQAQKGFRPLSAMFVIVFLKLFGNYLEFLWIFFLKLFGNFSGGLFWRIYFDGIFLVEFLGGFFRRIFFEEFILEEFFGRIFARIFCEEFNEKLFEYGKNLFVCQDCGFCQGFGLRKGRKVGRKENLNL